MIKKGLVIVTVFVILIGIISMSSKAFAVTGNEVLNSEQATELVEMKESANGKLAEYVEKYGSTPYGIVAYVLNIVRIYSIPFCFLGIAIGAIHRYVIGIRKLDTLEKGMGLIVTFVTLLIICQVLPLAFAMVVKFGRG